MFLSKAHAKSYHIYYEGYALYTLVNCKYNKEAGRIFI